MHIRESKNTARLILSIMSKAGISATATATPRATMGCHPGTLPSLVVALSHAPFKVCMGLSVLLMDLKAHSRSSGILSLASLPAISLPPQSWAMQGHPSGSRHQAAAGVLATTEQMRAKRMRGSMRERHEAPGFKGALEMDSFDAIEWKRLLLCPLVSQTGGGGS